jgi:hypothetical protein
MVRTFSRSCFVVGAAAVFSQAACFDTSSNVTSGTYPTILTVDPSLFRGTLPCGAPGLVQYVATVTDIDVRAPETLPPSPPISCENYASFGEPRPEDPNARGIKIDHLYIGVIDGYDRPVELAQDGRTIVDVDTKEVVLPRWTTTCGQSPWALPEAGTDPEADAGGALASPQEDAGTDTPPVFNTLRLPTQVIWKKEVVLRGCYPLASTPGPDASVGDANTGADAPSEPPRDASIDHESPDGVTPDDAGDGTPPDPDDGATSNRAGR